MATFGKIGAGTLLNHKRFAKEYVQDGLVALYDGIENAGWGKHDNKIQYWKDLTGNGHVLYAPTPKWVANGAIYSTKNNIFRTTASQGEWMRSLFTTGNYSFQVTALPLANAYGIFYFCYRTQSDFSLNGSGQSINENRLWFKCNGANYYSAMRSYHTSLPRMYHAGCSGTTGRLALNGWVTNISGNFAFTPISFQSALGANGELTDTSNWRGQTLYRFAVYNRSLTSDEINHNYQIDKARFNLP